MAKGQALIQEITAQYLKNDVPEFRPGDNVKVYVKIVEGDTHRIQVFEGLVIKRQGGGISETFTVRKISYGIGVERTFPVHAPVIDKIEVVERDNDWGTSVSMCFFMKSGGKKFVPLSRDCDLEAGDGVNPKSVEIITLERDGDDPIYRAVGEAK